MAERAKRFVIVGNGVAGTTCAETLRKNDADCEISLIGDERWPLYNRVALPPYIKGKATKQKVMMRTREQHEQRDRSRPIPAHDLGDARQLGSAHAAHAEFLRLEVDLTEDAEEMEKGRDDRSQNDRLIGHREVFDHQEGGGTQRDED